MRWRQYRAVWAWVEGAQCRREGILRHFGDQSSPTPSVAVLRRLRPLARPGGAGHGRAPAHARPGGRPRRARSSQIVATAQPGVGRTRCVEILRGGRSKVHREALLRRPAGLRRLPRPARRGRPRAVDALMDDGRAALHRRPLPEVGRRVTSPSAPPRSSRPQVFASACSRRARARTSRPSSTASTATGREVVAVGSDKPGAQALTRADAAGVPTQVFPAAEYAVARGARRRDGRVAARAGRRARRARGLHAARQRRLPGRVPAARDQRASGAAARVPGHPGDRAGARLRREGVRRDRALRRRGRGLRAGHPPAGARAARRHRRRTRSAMRCVRSSTI